MGINVNNSNTSTNTALMADLEFSSNNPAPEEQPTPELQQDPALTPSVGLNLAAFGEPEILRVQAMAATMAPALSQVQAVAPTNSLQLNVRNELAQFGIFPVFTPEPKLAIAFGGDMLGFLRPNPREVLIEKFGLLYQQGDLQKIAQLSDQGLLNTIPAKTLSQEAGFRWLDSTSQPLFGSGSSSVLRRAPYQVRLIASGREDFGDTFRKDFALHQGEAAFVFLPDDGVNQISQKINQYQIFM
jgi:hypothetical protein